MTSLSESIRECDSFVGSIFLTKSLLIHPSLMSLWTDDLVKDLRKHTICGYLFRNCKTVCFVTYRAATSNGRFLLPANVFGTARNFLLKTAAISYWIVACESLLSSARSSLWFSPDGSTFVTEHTALLTKLCGKPPISAVGLFIFVISMRDFFLSTLKGETYSHRKCPHLMNIDEHLAYDAYHMTQCCIFFIHRIAIVSTSAKCVHLALVLPCHQYSNTMNMFQRNFMHGVSANFENRIIFSIVSFNYVVQYIYTSIRYFTLILAEHLIRLWRLII